MSTLEDLANILKEKDTLIKHLVYTDKNTYISFTLTKKNGTKRIIHAPNPMLKRIQRKIKSQLEKIYIPPNCVKGFCINESIKNNALPHINKNNVFNIDLKNFFPSLSAGRVYGIFISKLFNFSEEVAFYLTKLCTVDNMLPQGSPASPIISNIISYNMDIDIMNYCKKFNISFTRYADDLTFSSNRNRFPKGLVEIKDKKAKPGEILYKIINKNNFEINEDKIRFFHSSVRQEVTNLTVNEKVNINKKYIKRIRTCLHNIELNGLSKATKTFYEIEYDRKLENPSSKQEEHHLNVLKGRIEFIRFILGNENLIFLKYAIKYNSIVGEEVFDTTFLTLVDYCTQRIYLIKNSTETSIGSGFITEDGYFITSTHVLFNKDVFRSKEDFDKIKKELPYDYNGSNIVDFIYYKRDYLDKPKSLHNIKITKKQFDSDIYLQKRKFKSKKVKLADDFDYSINSEVFLVGFGEYNKGEKPKFISSRIIGDSIFFERKYYQIKDKVYHGMSGGAVFNKTKEVIGIIYCGEIYNDSINNGFIPINKQIIKELLTNE